MLLLKMHRCLFPCSCSEERNYPAQVPGWPWLLCPCWESNLSWKQFGDNLPWTPDNLSFLISLPWLSHFLARDNVFAFIMKALPSWWSSLCLLLSDLFSCDFFHGISFVFGVFFGCFWKVTRWLSLNFFRLMYMKIHWKLVRSSWGLLILILDYSYNFFSLL